MRSSILCSLVLSCATGLLQLILSGAEKSQYVGQQKLLSNPRYALDIANAYCCGTTLLLFKLSALFLQATSFSGQLDSSATLQRPNMYRGSQQSDWVYAIAGASGGWVYSPDKTSKIPLQPTSAPFMGSIFGGMALAYLSIMFLLSIYISYMATPDAASSYLFLEPRFLVIVCGFLAFGTAPLVSDVYGGCSGSAATGSIVGFTCFTAAACFFDLLFVQWMTDRMYMYAKWAGLQAMAIVPLFFFLSGNVPPVIQACCGIAVAAATIANGVDLVFHTWNAAEGESSSSSGSAAATGELPAAQLMWQMPAPPFPQLQQPQYSAWISANSHEFPAAAASASAAAAATWDPLDYPKSRKRN